MLNRGSEYRRTPVDMITPPDKSCAYLHLSFSAPTREVGLKGSFHITAPPARAGAKKSRHIYCTRLIWRSNNALKQDALERGFSQAGELNVSALEFMPEVRDMCSAGRCHQYGKTRLPIRVVIWCNTLS